MIMPVGVDARHRALFAPVMIALALLCGCDRPPPPGASAEGEPGAYALASRTEPGGVRASAPPAAADDLDAPDAPSFFPRSSAAGGWIKTQPVRALALEDVQSWVGPELEAFAAREAFGCRYEQESGLAAEVRLLRFDESDEAYGAYSVAARGEPQRLTRYTRLASGGDALRWCAWQGEWVIVLQGAPAARSELVREGERLLGRVLLPIPAADPPRLLAALALAEAEGQAGPWMTRRMWTLVPHLGGVISEAQAAALDEVLALEGSAVLVAQRFGGAEADEANYVWVVEYPSADLAVAARERYEAARSDAQRDLPLTILIDPVGPYLLGSWSPEQESTMHVLPRLQHALSGAK